MADDRLIILDTTLRDGEQSPGASMNLAEKLEIAHALAELGVDIIEAGFPIASQGDFEAVQAISQQVQGPIIAGLARCQEADIDRAWEALRDSPKPRIHVFLATSAVHREHKLHMAKDEIVRKVVECVDQARRHCDDVEFSPEDAARTEQEFLAEVVEKAIDAGATTINIPDTVGYAVPDQYGAAFRYLKKHVRGIEKVTLSAHCHNDLGLAVANTLAAVKEGARQVECTINGLGERAGNCSLEEIVMAVRTRSDYYGLNCSVHAKRLCPTSRLVARVTGIQVQRNKAIVGQNAFAHGGGVHQDGMLKHTNTYEIMRPEEVGAAQTEIVLGKHSGRHALSERVRILGYHLDADQMAQLFENFKTLTDRKKTIFDADIEALAEAVLHSGPALWTLEAVTCNAGSGTVPCAAVVLWNKEGTIHRDASTGDGPIDAIFKTIERITGVYVKLREYSVTSVTEDEDAQGEAHVEAESNGRILRGRAISTDIIEASALAYLQVINRALLRETHKMNPQTEAVSVT